MATAAAADTLREAAACGDHQKVSEVVSIDKSLVNLKHTINGWTALHWASKRNHLPVVKLLLDAGADRSLQTSDGKIAAELTSNEKIAEELGGEVAVLNTDNGFVPSYLKAPLLPSYYKADLNVQSKPKLKPNHVQPSQLSEFPVNTLGELVLKARIAQGVQTDFIEIELDNCNRTFQGLLNLLYTELEIKSDSRIKIRKLPNTILRKDKDVARLTDFQEIEVILNTEEHCLQTFSDPKKGLPSESSPVLY